MENMQYEKSFKAAVLVLLLLALLPKISGALYITNPLCNGGPGSPVCSGSGVSCTNGETPSCSSGNGNPICSGTPPTPACSAGTAAPQCPNGQGLIDPSKVIFSGNSGAAQSILAVSLLIMIVMSFAIAIIYSIGYAFRLDKLLRFAKSEIGEIILTLLIVLLFIGTFTITSASIGTKNFFAAGSGVLNNNVFISDCSMLAQESFDLIGPMFGYGWQSVLLTMVGSLTIRLMPNYMGISFRPLAGISALSPLINTFIFGTGGFIMILMGVAVFIVIIYALFPLFLYLGIILRTLPWTRPAGGAFLGMFMAFYIMFPLLIYFLLVSYVPYLGTPGLSVQLNTVNQGTHDTITATCLSSQDGCQIQAGPAQSSGTTKYDYKLVKQGTGTVSDDSYISSQKPGCYGVVAIDTDTGKYASQVITVNPVSAPCQSAVSYSGLVGTLSGQAGSFNPTAYTSILSSASSDLNPYASAPAGSPSGLLNGFIYNQLEPVMYSLFSVALSLIISFDFMEAMGDVLGAPSLRSQNMLKRVL